MANKGNILVGTVGQGVMLSADDGESWTRASVRQGMHSDCIVRALREDARHPEVVFAGTDMGLYRSDDRGMKWSLLDNPMKGSVVWSVAIDPVDSAIMFAGTGTPSKPGIFRSTDGGKSWAALRVAIADDCANVGHPRTTAIARDSDPGRPQRAGGRGPAQDRVHRGQRRHLAQHGRRKDVAGGARPRDLPV